MARVRLKGRTNANRFSENTQTVLVSRTRGDSTLFAVASGQLLFLTNEKTKKKWWPGSQIEELQ